MVDKAAADRVRLSCDGPVAHVTLTRGERHNGVDLAMIEALASAARRLRRMRHVRAVILSGDGPSFCAGLDVKSVMGSTRARILGIAALCSPFRNRFQSWSLAWRDLPVPVLAVVHGNCFGAGMQLALGADLRLCTPDARLSVMEAKWGLVPDMGGTVLLRDVVALDVAKELTMTARVVSGVEAHALGLVTHVSDDPLADAVTLAQEISNRSPDAVAAGKFLLQEAWPRSESGALAAERRWQRRVIGRRNQRIAVRRNLQQAAAKGADSDSLPPFSPRQIGR
ncbi:MAG: crotonase/enoyl-CoA hydratase family protein [Gammaproteobacteria bacterium]